MFYFSLFFGCKDTTFSSIIKTMIIKLLIIMVLIMENK